MIIFVLNKVKFYFDKMYVALYWKVVCIVIENELLLFTKYWQYVRDSIFNFSNNFTVYFVFL